MTKKKTFLKDLLLVHELAFILLIFLVATVGAVGIQLQEQSSQESNRINLLVQEVQQTRGDLYRQMKELFDAYFLEDTEALTEYNNFTRSVESHFVELRKLTMGVEEEKAIHELHAGYQVFLSETSALFGQHTTLSNENLKRKLNTDLESGIFSHYERLLANTELLLNQKQLELEQKLQKNKRKSNFLLFTPLVLAILLLVFSRIFLKRSIVKPINDVLQATSEISMGNLTHKAPEEGVEELAALSKAINTMADKLMASQENLIRSEKQAAQGLLVPMLAHNIRNPLASIRATAQVMDDPALDTESRESISGIINTVDRLERWTGALLAYLHPLKPQPSQTSVREIVAGALAPLKQKIIEKSIRLSQPDWSKFNQGKTRSDAIFTDQHLLEQVIYNLVLNAIDASSHHDAIKIELEARKDEFFISINDQGSGLPFTPDPSAISAPTSKRFGTGLGIPFAFKVCDALGGSLQFSRGFDTGTQVTITLPKTLIVSDTPSCS
ncbi:MAG: sensor histidine kinase [Betaproteobacteria bacterium HGW-Betaproteobacteria-22]|nr:MAG: sensor histidine kinase [Betaproteobacteria bacterium HGW-Betaproteobacteria-22]